MLMPLQSAATILLVLSGVILGVMVPGGPIETRSFAHINPLILGAFNTFLTTLGLVSVLIAVFVARGRLWAARVSAVCGVFYFLVYAFDIGGVFPVTPSPMPPLLLLLEIIGAVVALPLVYSSVQIVRRSPASVTPNSQLSKPYALFVMLAIVAGFAIVIFATHAAMGE
jgi:hypothetical protein